MKATDMLSVHSKEWHPKVPETSGLYRACIP